MHLHTKNQRNPHHEFQDKCKLVVGDDGHFLENHALDWAETCQVFSSWCYALFFQISWESNLPIARYAHFNFYTFVDEHEWKCVAAELH